MKQKSPEEWKAKEEIEDIKCLFPKAENIKHILAKGIFKFKFEFKLKFQKQKRSQTDNKPKKRIQRYLSNNIISGNRKLSRIRYSFGALQLIGILNL